MSQELQVIGTNEQPVAFTFMFEHPVPRLAIKAFDADTPAHVYYFRTVDLPEDSVNIRFPITPKNLGIEFVTDNPFSITQTLKGPCAGRTFNVEYSRAAEVQRSFKETDVKVVWVDSMPQTPCKMCVEGPDAGTMTLSRAARACIPQQQWAFCVNHEFKHVHFDNEEWTDEAAFYEYMRQGYNISQAYRALVDILGRTPENVQRMMKLWKVCNNFNENFS